MIRPVFAANWKMHLTAADARAFMRTFLQRYSRRQDRTVIIFPSALALHAVSEAVHDRPDILVGVQDVHWEPQGAFTGANSVVQARDAGARIVLVGHSERRHVFGETDTDTAKKCAATIQAGLSPMLCVGETGAQRDEGAAHEIVMRQLRTGVASIEASHIGKIAIAYEPVWAIGTGRTATPADASEMHGLIRTALKEIAPERGGTIPILYGGSVNRGNVAELLAAPNVDGVLVGGASLDPEGWSSIIRTT